MARKSGSGPEIVDLACSRLAAPSSRRNPSGGSGDETRSVVLDAKRMFGRALVNGAAKLTMISWCSYELQGSHPLSSHTC